MRGVLRSFGFDSHFGDVKQTITSEYSNHC
ncbi:hypothetical protein H320_09910 [Vibrio parahaemolyticus 49]|nr:hypothetical protein M636_01620 [Vibrio parahaemolyticus O1:K33 str. CDC_K4557]KIT23081.1 hypothetical protein H323_10750 [Vibrio parahaemolyticus VP766]KIT34428.1 hypothetical protein H320_09910 [Vibrio parahaemolyticus 49]